MKKRQVMSPPNMMDVELVEGSFAPYELKVPCPACGSTDNWFKVEPREYTPPFGTTTRYEVLVMHCTACTEEMDYEPGPDLKRVSAILQHADQATVPVMLDRLEAAGVSPAAIKRVFALADPTDWRTGTKASTIALLRILTTYPWILEVASRHFDPEVAQTVLRQAAQIETNNQAALICENCGKKLLGNPDDCPCWEADYRWG